MQSETAKELDGQIEHLFDSVEGTLRCARLPIDALRQLRALWQTRLLEQQRTDGPTDPPPHDSHARYQSLFHNSPVALWEEDFSQVKQFINHLAAMGVTDLRQYFYAHPEAVRQCASLVRVIDVNQAAAELCQIHSRQELLASPHLIMADDSYSILRDQVIHFAEGGLLVDLEASIQTVPGETKEVMIRCAVAPGCQESLSRIYVAVTDITEHSHADEERQLLQAQIMQAQKVESLSILAGGIAHDFNNILVAILGYADLVLTKLPTSDPMRTSIEQIEKGARRAADLTERMLAYSGKGHFQIEALSMSQIVSDMKRMLQVALPKNANVQYHVSPNLPSIQADATQLRHVIMNLTMNAAESLGDQPGVVTISTGTAHCDDLYLSNAVCGFDLPAGEYVYLEVTDTGCGMDRSTVERIFDPFFTTKSTGRGLGLPAVLGIMRGHKGALVVWSDVGKGSTFRVLFAACDTAAIASIQQETPTTCRRKGTVLVVDDDQMVRGLAKAMVEEAGFSVLTASDGLEAIQVYERNRDAIVCVLLDLTMPKMGGQEAFTELRRIDPNVRVILSSGYSEESITEQFAGRGLVGFMQKPYRFSTLTTRLHDAIGDAKPK